MPSKLPPLPVKWYLASVAGALVLALALMGVFTALGGHQRTLAMTHALVPTEEDQDRQVQSVSPTSGNPSSAHDAASQTSTSKQPEASQANPANLAQQPSPPDPSMQPKQTKPDPQPAKTDPADPQNPDQPAPSQRPSLWSLLVSPEMVIGALSLVTIGTILQIRRTVLGRRDST